MICAKSTNVPHCLFVQVSETTKMTKMWDCYKTKFLIDNTLGMHHLSFNGIEINDCNDVRIGAIVAPDLRHDELAEVIIECDM